MLSVWGNMWSTVMNNEITFKCIYNIQDAFFCRTEEATLERRRKLFSKIGIWTVE